MALLCKVDEDIDVVVTTWRLGVEDSKKLKRIILDRNINFKLLLDVSFQQLNSGYFDPVRKALGDFIWLTKIHAKIMIVRSKKLNFCVLSSANFNRNLSYEFFDITESNNLCQYIYRDLQCFFSGPPLVIDTRSPKTVVREFRKEFTLDIVDTELPVLSLNEIM